MYTNHTCNDRPQDSCFVVCQMWKPWPYLLAIFRFEFSIAVLRFYSVYICASPFQRPKKRDRGDINRQRSKCTHQLGRQFSTSSTSWHLQGRSRHQLLRSENFPKGRPAHKKLKWRTSVKSLLFSISEEPIKFSLQETNTKCEQNQILILV